ncbi:hypothetical protein KSD_44810 [Ktedonobacter sp. SOSP1-85]|uniref:UPF0158 family protein n=1 Tax=Ktedonobacter sp. SOSP1-85 TaxID=2778367 RepID=UPI001915590F|nr:UPF0158 family protein [Ktedonobacter sp. SOSP1-85]GHO76710.1 hypothetical protein KSD_44810 [Ktedonobacter sp. SOSP1-85]
MATLPNGKPIDMDMLEAAMEDSDLSHMYYLNKVTGEVLFWSEDDDEEVQEKMAAEVDGSNDYERIDRIPSSEAYQWMADFVDEIVAPKDERAAENLAIALSGKGAFRRFKDVLAIRGGKWQQAWYDWREQRLNEAVEAWLKDIFEQ